MWRYDGYEECKNVYRKQIKKTSTFICLIFLCHKLIIKMHCIGTWLKEWITLCLQIKISRRICNRLEPLRYQYLSLFIHFWNLKCFDNRTKGYCVPFRQTGCVFRHPVETFVRTRNWRGNTSLQGECFYAITNPLKLARVFL